MSPDLIMLFVCIALALVGVLAAAVAFRRHSPGRMVQAGAVVLLPIALYFTGLLRLVVQAAAAIGTWAVSLAFSPLVWIGFGLLGVTVVLWVVGGYVARRQRDRAIAIGSTPGTAVGSGAASPALGARKPAPAAKTTAKTSGGKKGAPVDDDLAEIEALLKRRGID